METILRMLKRLNRDEVLRLLGLEQRRHPIQRASASFLTASLGALAGLGAGLLLAPRSGAEFRARLLEPSSSTHARRPRRAKGLVPTRST